MEYALFAFVLINLLCLVHLVVRGVVADLFADPISLSGLPSASTATIASSFFTTFTITSCRDTF